MSNEELVESSRSLHTTLLKITALAAEVRGILSEGELNSEQRRLMAIAHNIQIMARDLRYDLDRLIADLEG